MKTGNHINGKQHKGWSKNVGGFDGTNMRYLLVNDGEIKCSIYDSTLIAFEQLLQQAKFEKTNTIMVYSPVYYMVQENMSICFDTIMSTYQELSEKYNIKYIQPVDIFPYTAHVESITLLELKK